MAEGPPYKDAASVPHGTPTPTQDELNKIAIGEAVELAKDGTPEEPQLVLHAAIGVKPAAAATPTSPATSSRLSSRQTTPSAS